jgi:hypothetical protein
MRRPLLGICFVAPLHAAGENQGSDPTTATKRHVPIHFPISPGRFSDAIADDEQDRPDLLLTRGAKALSRLDLCHATLLVRRRACRWSGLRPVRHILHGYVSDSR